MRVDDGMAYRQVDAGSAAYGLVVKTGSKTRDRSFGGMPGPLWVIIRRTCDCAGLCRVRDIVVAAAASS
jgi:hypothetical protein